MYIISRGLGLIKKIDKKLIELLFVVAVVRVIYYENSVINLLFPDSSSYLNYSYVFAARTPGYPLVIDLCQFIGGNSWGYLLFMIQAGLSLISVCLFYHAILLWTNWPIAVVATLFYGCNPSIFLWDTCVLTESLSISFTLIFICCASYFVKKIELKFGVCLPVISFICCMIKPALVIYPVCVLILMVIMYFTLSEKRAVILRTGFVSIAVIGVVLLYMKTVYDNTGVFSTTDVNPRHSLVKVLESQAYKSYSDKKLVAQIDTIYSENNYDIGYVTTTPIMMLFGDNSKEINTKVAKFCRECIRDNFGRYIENIIRVTIDMQDIEFYASRGLAIRNNFTIYFEKPLTGLFQRANIVQTVFAPILLLISVIFLKSNHIKFRIMCIGIFGGEIAIFISTVIGTYGDWTRCMCCILPFFYISASLLLSVFFRFQTNILGEKD